MASIDRRGTRIGRDRQHDVAMRTRARRAVSALFRIAPIVAAIGFLMHEGPRLL
jgi:hypothetical protein